MAIIKPFRALRPSPELAAAVASRPYDVLSSSEARTEAENNPCSFYHISKAEIDLPSSTDIHSAEVYDMARKNLERFMENGTLIKDSRDCYYIYELTMDGKIQTGLAVLSSLEDYEKGLIRKHELTRPDKETDRMRHMDATGAQTGNVFLAMADLQVLSGIIHQWTDSHSPDNDFEAADKIRHRLWVMDDAPLIGRITEIFAEQVPCTYIADGHHRAASAFQVLKSRMGNGIIRDPEDPSRFFLTTIFPASELRILDYNRVVKDLNGWDIEPFLNQLNTYFEVVKQGSEPYRPQALHEFGMYLECSWYRLKARPGTYRDTPTGVLDVSILQELVLDRLLGIKDVRADPRIDFVGGMRGLAALAGLVDSGQMKVAFALFPVTIRQLFNIADSGQIMPPKSTWFEPKLRDGLLTYLTR
jgi:uncharacterized protein (DUF1015 family)